MVVEVQQRGTDFKGRTDARVKGGAAQTIWMLSHDANSKTCANGLFTIPAVRFTVLDSRLPWTQRWLREFEPWLDGATLDEFAVVWVWATTWQLIGEAPYLRTFKLDLQVFLREILEGRRVWVSGDPAMPRSKYGRPRPGWVLLDDLDEVRARIARDAAEDAAAAAAAAVSAESELVPEVSGAADDGGAEPPATPLPPIPRSPVPAPKPALAGAWAHAAAARQPVRPPVAAQTDDVDWAFWLKVLAGIVGTLVIGLCVYRIYVEVSAVAHHVEAWWDHLFEPPAPEYHPCNRGNPFCH